MRLLCEYEGVFSMKTAIITIAILLIVSVLSCGESNDPTGSSGIEPEDSVIVVGSYDISADYDGDLTFDGSHLWILTDGMLQQLSTQGQVLETLNPPGNYPRGIASNNLKLIVGDDHWGTGLIYQISDDCTILNAPGSGHISGLGFDGTHLWGANCAGIQNTLYQFTTEGTVLDSLPCEIEMVEGLTCDESSIWISGFDTGSGRARIYQIDYSGNPIFSFEVPVMCIEGLTTDGTHLWLSSGSDPVLWKYTTSGELIDTINIPGSQLQDIAFDGTYLWVAEGYLSSTNQILQLDTNGTLISSVPAPGDAPGGLTFADDAIWVADVITGKIYKLFGENISVLGAFPSFSMTYMTYDGSQIWCINNDNKQIVAIDDEGLEITIIPWSNAQLNGIVFNADTLWVIDNGEMNTNADKLYAILLSGEITATYSFTDRSLPRAYGLAHDGSNLWYIGIDPLTGEKLFRLELQ